MTSSPTSREDVGDRADALGFISFKRPHNQGALHVRPGDLRAVYGEEFDSFFGYTICDVAVANLSEPIRVLGTAEEILTALSQANAERERSPSSSIKGDK